MRLGDDIDDHCSRCKRTTDHSIVSMMGEEVLRTRCRTCNSEHKYRQNKSRSKEMTAKEAFDHSAGQRYRRAAGDGHPYKKEKEITTKDTKAHKGSGIEILGRQSAVGLCFSISAIASGNFGNSVVSLCPFVSFVV